MNTPHLCQKWHASRWAWQPSLQEYQKYHDHVLSELRPAEHSSGPCSHADDMLVWILVQASLQVSFAPPSICFSNPFPNLSICSNAITKPSPPP